MNGDVVEGLDRATAAFFVYIRFEEVMQPSDTVPRTPTNYPPQVSPAALLSSSVSETSFRTSTFIENSQSGSKHSEGILNRRLLDC